MTKLEKKVKLKKLKLKKKKKAPKKRRVINNNKNKNVQKINIKVGGQPAQQRAAPFPVVMQNQTPNIDTNAINNLVSELKESRMQSRMQSKINKPMRNSFATPDIEHDQQGTFASESFNRFGVPPMEDLNGALKDEEYNSQDTINGTPIISKPKININEPDEMKIISRKTRNTKTPEQIMKEIKARESDINNLKVSIKNSKLGVNNGRKKQKSQEQLEREIESKYDEVIRLQELLQQHRQINK